MKQRTLLLLFLCSFAALINAQQPVTFRNPVIPEDMADPSIVAIGNLFYATGTSSEWAPHYPMYVSTDLINWEQIGSVFEEKPEWTLSSFWAPELYYHNGKLFVYYTARNKEGVTCLGVASAEKPYTNFTDHGLLLEYGTEAIDAFVLEDNGQLYISWKAYGLDQRPIELMASTLSDDGLRLEGEPFSLLVDEENIGMEGQHWMKYGDYYYMIYSVGGCCGPGSDYRVYVARSKNLKGPYEKYSGNPILHGDGQDILSCGHGTVTTTQDGRMFYLYHAYLTNENFFGGRQVMLQELYFGEDNWVHFKSGNKAQIVQPVPLGKTIQKEIRNFHDHFYGDISLKWTWNYPYSKIRLKSGNKKLSLSGEPIGDNKNGTALCVRPTSPHYSYHTRVINKNSSFKGLTMYGDSKNLLTFGAVGDQLIVRLIKDGNQNTLYTNRLPAKSPYLKIEVSKGVHCSFYWSKDGKNWQKLLIPDVDTTSLVRWDRVARLGLIHSGSTDEPAEFQYFELLNKAVCK